MVISNEKIPMLLIYKGVPFEKKVASVVKAQNVSKYNKNNRRPNEQKKNVVKTTAAILRIQQKRES
jgi:hypothetical protein